ncbi:TetR/AcrR family transcriptional regulator [Thalassoglobus sp.]|uniref:TetR/AcrR family transcriptional regulator n=1 Tax=Thalassoglobus sp. TaxID=2795869 RepID=UPI003AA853B4
MVRPRTISDQQILEVASKCFLERGPSVSTDVIAHELGVTSQALLKRFRNKKELLIAAMKPCRSAPWLDMVEEGPDDRPVDEQLTEILRELASFFSEIVRRMEILQWSGVSMKELMASFDEPPPVRDIRAIAGWLRRLYEKKMIRKIDFDATAMFILTAMHGPAMLTQFLGKPPTGHTFNEYISQYVNILLYGLLDSSNSEIEQ